MLCLMPDWGLTGSGQRTRVRIRQQGSICFSCTNVLPTFCGMSAVSGTALAATHPTHGSPRAAAHICRTRCPPAQHGITFGHGHFRLPPPGLCRAASNHITSAAPPLQRPLQLWPTCMHLYAPLLLLLLLLLPALPRPANAGCPMHSAPLRSSTPAGWPTALWLTPPPTPLCHWHPPHPHLHSHMQSARRAKPGCSERC